MKIRLVFLLCLCFALKAQAQLTKVEMYTDKVKSLSDTEKEKLESLLFGPVPQLQFKENGDPIFVWENEGPVKAIAISFNEIGVLKNVKFASSFKTTEVIGINWEKGKPLPLKPDDLKQFKSLRYIVIKSMESISIDELKKLLNELISSKETSGQVEILYLKMQLPS